MNATLQSLCDSYVQNRDILKKAEKMAPTYLYPVCAEWFCAQGKTANQEQIAACKALLKKKTNVFSSFRGTATLPLLCLLSLEDDPEQKLDDILARYALLKKSFMSSEALALAALLLPGSENAEALGSRAKTIYHRMSKNHPFLTSSDDMVYAVLMAATGKKEEALFTELEECYAILKDSFGKSSHAMASACVLALDGRTPPEKAYRVAELYDAIAQSGLKYGKNYELPVLASLSLTGADSRLLASDLVEMDAFLSDQKGYGFFGMGKKARLMHAAMLLSIAYGNNCHMTEAAYVSMFALIAAQRRAAANS